MINFFKLIRVHHWIKNFLIFVPLILSQSFTTESFLYSVIGFFSFSFIASAFYIFNDLLDIKHDRNHATKKHRPIASGSISINNSKVVFVILLILGFFLSFFLNQGFQLILLLYALFSFLYSKKIKSIPVLDILILTSLYSIRIISGALINEIPISNWLITFSVFFFLFLASVKRWIEIERSENIQISSRGYIKDDQSFIGQLSNFTGLISILIICLYLDSQQAMEQYSRPQLLWIIPIIMLYWIVYIQFKVQRNEVDDDPVIFVLRNQSTYICLLIILFVFIFSI